LLQKLRHLPYGQVEVRHSRAYTISEA
jgi:hypothetical protein